MPRNILKAKTLVVLTKNVSDYIKNKYDKQINCDKIIEIIKNNSKNEFCKNSNCLKIASYGIDKKYFCNKHKEKEHKNFRYKNRICKYENCGRFASYGKSGSKIVEFCINHKPSDYIDITHKTCKFCKKRPSYGLKNGSPEYCVEHKIKNCIDLTSNKCIVCGKVATYSNPGNKKKQYCIKHKLKNSIKPYKKFCKYVGCKTEPSYGHPNSKIVEFCVKHKPKNYIEVNKNRCIYNNCGKIPTFGVKNTKKALYCKKHKPSDYIDVVSTKCKYIGCDTQAGYGDPLIKISEYCLQHKPSHYVDVKNKFCKINNCGIQATYGNPDSRKAEYCVHHKPVHYVNVVSSLCVIDNCGTRVRFGKLFEEKTHCAKHKLPGQYYKNNPRCVVDDCKEKPMYTNENNNYPLRCENHKFEDDVDVISRICSSCGLTDFIKNGNLCNDCSTFDVIRKKQENIIKQLLDDNNIVYDTYDKIIKDGCSTKRPDFTFDLGDRVIILEVDENQHKSYPCECEQTRMIQIHQDYGGLDVCFIRYNPDNYKDKNNKLVKSVKGRHKKLIETLNGLKNHKPKYKLSVVYLYYDGYDEINEIQEIKY